MADVVAPVADEGRLESLDILRGMAVLGILAMNIVGFGLPWQAYNNPPAAGGKEGINLLTYHIVSVGFEGTMRGIFSLLFGAGIVLLTSRMEQAGAGVRAADIHMRRMLWLMVAGFIHWSLLLWIGEILFAYSICGLLLFAFRHARPRLQLVFAALLLTAATVDAISEYHHAVAAQPAAGEAAGEDWQELLAATRSDAEDRQMQRDWHKGRYADAVAGQWEAAHYYQWIDLPHWLVTDVIPFMLIGMALLQLGVLQGHRPARIYCGMILGGYAIGLPLGLLEESWRMADNFGPVSYAQASITYEISRLAMVVGHLGLAILFIRSGALGWLQRALAATGRMALSNYVAQTIICTVIFYSFGFGLGLFDRLERHQLYGIVLAIWVVQLVWSPWWLGRYRFGPLEWLWRSLTYWKRQPMRQGS